MLPTNLRNAVSRSSPWDVMASIEEFSTNCPRLRMITLWTFAGFCAVSRIWEHRKTVLPSSRSASR